MNNVIEMEELKLKSSEDRLTKLIESPEWEDVAAVIDVLLGWEMSQLLEDSGNELTLTQGRCLVLRELFASLTDQLTIIAMRNNSGKQSTITKGE